MTDLAVNAVTESSVTLGFTEVDDGTGQPAQYDIRMATGWFSWRRARHVASGTCAVPVAGTSIGAKRVCTVTGLATGTRYTFQMAAFRGTLGVDAVFGQRSAQVTATPVGGGGDTSAAPVASVAVTPDSVSLNQGQTTTLTATEKDSAGNTLAGRSVTWTSGDSSVATVSGAGLVTAVAPGMATVTASSEGRSGQARIVVTVAQGSGGFVTPDILDNVSFESGWNGFTSGSFGTPTAVSRDGTQARDGGWSVLKRLPVTSSGGDVGGGMTYGFYYAPPGRSFDHLWSRFWFYFDQPINGTFKFQIWESAGFNNQFGGLYCFNGMLSWWFVEYAYAGISGSLPIASLASLAGGWHSIEVEYWRNGHPSGFPAVALWLDGNPITNDGSHNAPSPSSWSGNYVIAGRRDFTSQLGTYNMLGVLNGSPANTVAGNVWVDRVSLSSVGRIGP